MIAAIGAVALLSVLSAAALAAARGDLNLTQHDLDRKKAFAAAQAGIADFSYHLNNDNSYWAKCTEVPDPNAMNDVGETTNRRTLSGGGEYAIESLPAEGYAKCDPNNSESMIEKAEGVAGTFRIRATGFDGDAEASIVAAYKRTSFLDFIYMTNYETSDPLTYGSSSEVTRANNECKKYRRERRSSWCNTIVFRTGDEIRGPLHTNDELAICGEPTFGRGPADTIEVSAKDPGWFDYNCSGFGTADPDFVGPLKTTADILEPPPTNGELQSIAGSAYTFTCASSIVLSGTNMTVESYSFNGTKPFPASGVVYIANGNEGDCNERGRRWSACPSLSSPYKATYSKEVKCGNVFVSGNYSGKLTIAADNDIIINGNINREGSGMLGLIANNFIRVWHPYPSQGGAGSCGSGFGSEGIEDLEIDAAILAIAHSFIVDHYDCGASLGTLTVNGSISQQFRGPVGTTGSPGTGYLKDYTYDDRLRYMEPPHFLEPVKSSWRIQRENLDIDPFG
jgi:Tfp pilus assembly protein PilX